MANLFEYAERFGGIKFNEIGLTEADNAIFSRLAYCDFSEYAGKTLGEISKLLNISDESAENKKHGIFNAATAFANRRERAIQKNIIVLQTRETVSEDFATAFLRRYV
ncbi:MAG: hypothetical protein L6V88_05470 [Anaerotruncus sp.]|nr:MAG: hypothetical protein L6V88_05470 [Anaerotruncus sp.]